MVKNLRVSDYEYYLHQGSKVPISMIINNTSLKEGTILTVNKTAFIVEDIIETFNDKLAKYNVGILHTPSNFYKHSIVDYKNKKVKCWENITVDEFDMILNMIFSINGETTLSSDVIYDEHASSSAFDKLYAIIKKELK